MKIWGGDVIDLFEKVRPSFFSGFLTITGFLLAAHTFIVTHMKKEMYDRESYHKLVSERRQLNPNHSYYGPLRRFSGFLLATMLMSLGTAVLQVTYGLAGTERAAFVCVGFAGATITLLVISVILMAINLRAWFMSLEEEMRDDPAR